MRVFNKASKDNTYRCTICKTEKTKGESEDPKKIKGKK